MKQDADQSQDALPSEASDPLTADMGIPKAYRYECNVVLPMCAMAMADAHVPRVFGCSQ